MISMATILHRGGRPLSSFDPDLVDMLVARTRALGIDVQLHTEVNRIDRRADGFHVEATTAGQTRGFTADMVVHGAGRVPEIDDLDSHHPAPWRPTAVFVRSRSG